METMLFGALTLAVILLAWRERDNRSTAARAVAVRGLAFGVVAGLTTLTRPEGVVLVGLVGLALLIVRPQGSFGRVLLWGGAALLSFLIVLAPYLVLNLQITGGLLPDTAVAKRAGVRTQFVKPYLTRVAQMVNALLGGAHVLLVPGMLLFAVQAVRRHNWLNLLPLAWGVGLFFVYAAYLPAPYHHGRYVIPALPALIVCGVVGTARLLDATRTSVVGRVLARTLALSAVLAFAYFAFAAGSSAYRTDVRIIEEEMVTAARWMADNLPSDQLIALNDIGAVGYFAPRPILDVAGLITPEVVPFIGDVDAMWLYIYERDARYIAGFVDQLPGGNLNDPRYCQIFSTNGQTTQQIIRSSAKNFNIYALTWDGRCDN
jgi:4-amino-4-deoxy-L-arabinose transferase-like glycosyltransferase